MTNAKSFAKFVDPKRRIRGRDPCFPPRFPMDSPRPKFRLILVCAILAPVCAGAGSAASEGVKDLALEVVMQRSGRAVNPNDAPRPGGSGNEVAVSRADLIISEVAYRDRSGEWLPPARWEGFFSATKEDRSPPLTGLPRRDYDAVRFRLGPPPELNHADPARFAAGHPLNPNHNGMHWKWQTGYIFLALEGAAPGPDGGTRGFSYHLGNTPQHVEIEVPVDLPADHRTLTLGLDLDVLLDFDLAAVKSSTHSRRGDPLAARLAERTRESFRFVGSRRERIRSDAGAATAALPPGTSPYPLEIPARFPRVELPPDNPPTQEGVALGRALFFDPALSRDRSVSCASCHDPGAAFADPGKKFSFGIDGRSSVRNSMPLFNLAWHGRMFWDGRAASLREQVLHPIEDPREMGHDLDALVDELGPQYGEAFAATFGDGGVTADRLARALEQFLLTLVSSDSRFDRAVRGEVGLSAREKRGFELFVTENDPARNLRGADCFHCHGGSLFTNHDFHNNGLTDSFEADGLGLAAVTGNESDTGKFKTPSLRNVALTPPYMHDGRFATLEEVVAHYNDGVHPSPTLDPNLAKHDGLGLSDREQADLVAFLHTLTDADFANDHSAADSNDSPP